MGGFLVWRLPKTMVLSIRKWSNFGCLSGYLLGVPLLASSGRQDIEGLEPAVLRSLGQGAAQMTRGSAAGSVCPTGYGPSDNRLGGLTITTVQLAIRGMIRWE